MSIDSNFVELTADDVFSGFLSNTLRGVVLG